jgi:multidrug efflux pump subunit AcrA (membrane-fusion protein)
LEFRLEGEQKWRKGVIARVSPATENPNRFFDVFLAAENERNNGQWLMRPGMFAEMRLPRVTVDKALALRASAVKRDGNLEHVFVVRKGKEAAQAAQPEAAEQPGALRKLFTGAIALLKGKRASSPNPGTAAQPEAKEIEVWKAFRVPVTTGLRAEGYVQIAGGELRDGDIVVSNPRAELPDDTKVRILKRAEPLESGKKQ